MIPRSKSKSDPKPLTDDQKAAGREGLKTAGIVVGTVIGVLVVGVSLYKMLKRSKKY